MNAFKKKLLVRAVEGVFIPLTRPLTPIVPETEAVLVYPYYTIQAEETKTVTVLFKEGKNAREVTDFNLYLSPEGVWGSFPNQGRWVNLCATSQRGSL